MLMKELVDRNTLDKAAASFTQRHDDEILFKLLLQEYGPYSLEVQSHYLYNIYYPTLINRVKLSLRRSFNKFIMLASFRFWKRNGDYSG